MPYATQQNLIDRFGEPELIQLTDRAQTGAIDAAVLDQAIADADAEINSYLTAYSLPLLVVPANLVRVACDIARYYLYDDQMVESVKQRYDNAIAWLKLVAAGKIVLPADATGELPEPTSNDVEFTAADTVFNTNTLGGF